MATEQVRGTGRPAPRGLIIGLFVAYACVILALTTLKAFFRIGLLWCPERQRVRSLELVPFDNFFRSPTWFGPVFDAVGNVAFFVPFGWLVAVLAAGAAREARLRRGSSGASGRVRHPVWKAALAGLGFSVLIETTQFVFGLGRSDIDDVIYNTCGAVCGGWIAGLGGRCWQRLLLVLTAVAAVVFVVLVALGDRLGDPALTDWAPEEVAAVENALRDRGAADQAG